MNQEFTLTATTAHTPRLSHALLGTDSLTFPLTVIRPPLPEWNAPRHPFGCDRALNHMMLTPMGQPLHPMSAMYGTRALAACSLLTGHRYLYAFAAALI